MDPRYSLLATKHPDANLECFRLDGALDTILAPTNLLNPSEQPHPLFHQQHNKYKITCSQKEHLTVTQPYPKRRCTPHSRFAQGNLWKRQRQSFASSTTKPHEVFPLKPLRGFVPLCEKTFRKLSPFKLASCPV